MSGGDGAIRHLNYQHVPVDRGAAFVPAPKEDPGQTMELIAGGPGQGTLTLDLQKETGTGIRGPGLRPGPQRSRLATLPHEADDNARHATAHKSPIWHCQAGSTHTWRRVMAQPASPLDRPPEEVLEPRPPLARAVLTGQQAMAYAKDGRAAAHVPDAADQGDRRADRPAPGAGEGSPGEARPEPQVLDEPLSDPLRP